MRQLSNRGRGAWPGASEAVPGLALGGDDVSGTQRRTRVRGGGEYANPLVDVDGDQGERRGGSQPAHELVRRPAQTLVQIRGAEVFQSAQRQHARPGGTRTEKEPAHGIA